MNAKLRVSISLSNKDGFDVSSLSVSDSDSAAMR